jgi:endonuclease YncB( thermonuclease family)
MSTVLESKQATTRILGTLAICLVTFLFGLQATDAHRSGCHRWHSCPSDRGTYTCGDLGYCNYCPDNQYCQAGKPKAAATKQKTTKPQLGTALVLTGRVVKVADGDTITVLDNTNTQHRIRLQGIDSPEKGQPFGNASRKHLAKLVTGKTVTVKWDKRDRYRRIVGFVIVDGKDMNLSQLKAGMAWFYRYYQKELSPEKRKLYARAEDEARANKKGLWQDKNPMPPWEWRRLNR